MIQSNETHNRGDSLQDGNIVAFFTTLKAFKKVKAPATFGLSSLTLLSQNLTFPRFSLSPMTPHKEGRFVQKGIDRVHW